MKKMWISLIATFFVASGSLIAATTASGYNIAKCTKCHNERPEGGFYQFPRLAGQTVNYFISSMTAYQNLKRHNVTAQRIMSPKRLKMDAATLQELAEYFNKLPPAPGIPSDNAELVAAGKDIYENGIPDREIDSCTSCHGKNGEGKVKGIKPRLAGQYKYYFVNQMLYYRNGDIEDNEDMKEIANSFTRAEIDALGTYLQTL